MFYPKNSDPKLSLDLFKNPTKEYRGTPFWSWNGKLEPELLTKEIEKIKETGFGGFHMHVRIGLETPYLSDEFMKSVKLCVDKAKEEGMLAYLYDEDRWPSGFAGGLNTKKEENRQKAVYMTDRPYNDGTLSVEEDIKNANGLTYNAKYYVIGCYDIHFDSSKKMLSYEKIGTGDRASGTKWFAYLRYNEYSEYYNGTYVDTMKKSAIEDFISLTHEKYKAVVGDEFGKTVPSIFCDEPAYKCSESMKTPYEHEIEFAFTDDFDDTFKKQYGYSIIDRLPEIVFEFSDGRLSKARHDYHNHAADRFAEAFGDTIGEWCEKNNIIMTGHLNREPSLDGMTTATGDTMRSYRAFGIPGVDVLSDHHELSCLKQCQSSVRQYGREGMASELYGVTTWEFDFRGHKQQGDWQAAMGVTVRVPHLFWMSMKGDGKRDYPASIGYQAPWYKEYPYMEDHFARVNTVMTRGKPIVHIGVIHPIESYWFYFGPWTQTNLKRRELASRYYELINWLMFGSHDFDMICEANLASQYKETESGFRVGYEQYDTVIVPGLVTIRSSTLEALEKFAGKGGKVIFLGKVPAYVDAVESDRPAKLAERCSRIDWSKSDLFDLIEDNREISILGTNGDFSTNLIYNLKQDGDVRHVFIAHVTESKDYNAESPEKYVITFKGEWILDLFDTLDGTKKELAAEYENGNTVISWECYRCDSLLLEMTPGKRESGELLKQKTYTESEYLDDSASFTLEEPNVLLLDQAKFSINGSEFGETEEILRISNKVKDALVTVKRRGQPWIYGESDRHLGNITLLYEFDSEIECSAKLALESIKYSTVTLNGVKADMTDRGYYIDEDAIRVINLPDIKKGHNVLKIELDVCEHTYIESCYLLGDFGVKVEGRKATVIPMPKEIHYGNLVGQGLPFYSGNIVYHTKFTGDKKTLEIQRYDGMAVSVAVDGRRCEGMLAFPPNRIYLGDTGDGEHTLDITLYGKRVNTLAPLHDVILKPSFASPETYKRGDRWFTYDYLFRENGILTAPRIIG